MESLFMPGDNVRVVSTGKVGTINSIIKQNAAYGYKVTIDGKTVIYQEKFLENFFDEESVIMEQYNSSVMGSLEDFRLFQMWYRLNRPVETNLYSYMNNKIIFNPYQYKPLYKFISHTSQERLFIADEVGVGKTIEAGIIITEMIARGRLTKMTPVLIVCPNALGPKWQNEMREKFSLRFKILDSRSLGFFLRSITEGDVPEEYLYSIVSLQVLRMEKNLNQLHQIDEQRINPFWRFVVVDEAHHMRNKETEANKVGCVLSRQTEMLLMLSATPLNLCERDLFNQLQILNPDIFVDEPTYLALTEPTKLINQCRKLLISCESTVPLEITELIEKMAASNTGKSIISHPDIQLLYAKSKTGESLQNREIARIDRALASLSPIENTFTRTLKREAFGEPIIRETMTLPVILSDEEMTFYNDVVEITKEAYLFRSGDSSAIGFVTNMPKRMVSSCIPAMKTYLESCVRNASIPDIDLEDSDYDLDDKPDTTLPPEMIDIYKDLLKRANRLSATDSKFEQFVIFVEKVLASLNNKQIVVFSFFVRTLHYLQDKLSAAGYSVGVLSGDVPMHSDLKQMGRCEIIQEFEDGKIQILLASEVGSEGLDFQFCQSIINYDMPYNPMRVEQRIGRIDRFGQKAKKIIIGNLYIEGTVDERVYDLLFNRINIIEMNVGYLEPIIGKKVIDLQNDIISGNLTDSQYATRARDIELSIEKSKIEMDNFEKNYRSLVQDDQIVDYLSNVDRSDFVNPQDAIQLTRKVMQYWSGCSLKMIDKADLFGILTVSKELTDALEEFLRKPDCAGYYGAAKELRPIIDNSPKISVVFDGTAAVSNPHYHFLSPCGHWSKFLLNEIEKRKNLYRNFKIEMSLKNLGLPEGEYVVPIFETKIEGFRNDISLNAVPVEINSFQIVQTDYVQFSRLLIAQSTESSENGFGNWGLNLAVDEVVDKARQQIEMLTMERINTMQIENEYQIEMRKASLLQGLSSRKARLEEGIAEHRERAAESDKDPNERYIKGIQTRISNDEECTLEKIKTISQKNNIAFNISLAAIVLLEDFEE